MKRTLLAALLAAVISSSAVYAFMNINFEKQNSIMVDNITSFIDEGYSLERLVIEKFPVYEDWIKDNNENDLRKYLYSYHLPAAKKLGIGPLEKDEDISAAVSENKLVRMNDSSDTYYFYGVPAEYRYLTPDALKMLEKIGTAVNEKISAAGGGTKLKIAVSSAVRPSQYQNSLSKRNANAVDESTHSYGTSIDLFYDDFYVVFPEKNENSPEGQIYSKLRSRTGFMLGDSLRRQFHSVLASVLLEMQEKGEIYIINERHQKCFHVTIAESL